MGKKKPFKPQLISSLLHDHFSDTWKLLTETTWFLSRTPDFALYEDDLRSHRRDLQNAGMDADKQKRIRQDIIELRKSLRLEGYDLSLARQNLVLDGFRNDSSLGEGFRRVVIFFSDDNAYWLSGDDNHVTLSELLEMQLRSRDHSFFIRSKHYLWYLRKGNKLIISGSDTETKDDFRRFEAMAEANSLKILSQLKYLK